MKFWSVLVLQIALAVSCLASPPEIQPWRRYPQLAVPADAPVTVSLTPSPVWHLDCGEDAAVLVGRIVAAAPGLNGRTLLVDRQLCRVLVVDPQGRVERTCGHKGEGPGELSGAYRAFQLGDGRIGITDGAPALTILFGGRGRITLLDQAGNPAGLWYAAGDPGDVPVCSVRELRCAGGQVLTASQHMVMSASTATGVEELALIATDSGRRTVIANRVTEEDMRKSGIREQDVYEPFADGRCDISVSGRVAFAPQRDRWLVVIREQDGTGFILQRSWQAVPRTRESREAVRKTLGASSLQDVSGTEPAIGRLRWLPDGRLWVEPGGVETAPGAMACFDEFSPDGLFLRRVQVMIPGDRDHDRLEIMEDGRLVWLRGFRRTPAEADEHHAAPEVVLFTLKDG